MPVCPGQDTRYWRPGDIFEIQCAHCGSIVEFFKDEGFRRCRNCGHRVQNPKVTLGCAQWCEHAKECLGYDPKERREEDSGESSLAERLIREMKKEFGADEKRIAHALKVLDFARRILRDEDGVPRVVLAAAVLHDIGIREAERKHGSSAGNYQEIEGPPIARRIMTGLELDADTIDHVCRIVGSHHSARDIDTPEFRILWDADWLVNIPDEFPDGTREKLKEIIEKVFRTKTGKDIAAELFLQDEGS